VTYGQQTSHKLVVELAEIQWRFERADDLSRKRDLLRLHRFMNPAQVFDLVDRA
jgi:hypothetical protein